LNAAVVIDPAGTLMLQIRQIRFEGAGINSYELIDPAGGELPAFTAGAHIDVTVGPQLVRQYSLCNDPGERHHYVIAVLRDEGGRGGSKLLHQNFRVQDLVRVSVPRNHFQLSPGTRRAILLAGGIGVTPLKAMAHSLDRAGIPYELHYCSREPGHAAFRAELEHLARGGVHHRHHHDRGVPADGLDITALLEDVDPDTHLYYCGPGGFMKACAAASAHWPRESVHSEHFKAPEPAPNAAVVESGSFEVLVASTGQTVRVASNRSIVDALADIGMTIDVSCQSGLCGTCKVRYLEGEVEHNDFILDDSERSEYLTACVSRANSELLVLDL